MEKIFNILKNSGSKLTPQRKVVLENLYITDKPVTLKELHNSCQSVDFASIFRSIKLFQDLGLVEEINFADKKIRYKLASKQHHHHIICSECGEISELPICLLSEIKKLTNYKITKHTLEFMGLCPSCQK
jgi:Fe2+ or Zn2+ uptake regulation protein